MLFKQRKQPSGGLPSFVDHLSWTASGFEMGQASIHRQLVSGSETGFGKSLLQSGHAGLVS